MKTKSKPSRLTFVLFGATGDLTRLKILPGLCQLHEDGGLPEGFRLLLVGRREMDLDKYKHFLATAPEHPFTEDISQLNPEYVKVDFDNLTGFTFLWQTIKNTKPERVIYFLALPPDIIKKSIEHMERSDPLDVKPAQNAQAMFEKPYGDTMQDAKEINERLEKLFGTENVFRNDHYLHKDAMKTIRKIRASDPMIRDAIDRREIKRIEIVASEKVDIGARASYFDGRGITVDWFQSHLLQMLASLIVSPSTPDQHHAKADFISTLHVKPGTIARAQYEGYKNAEGVDPTCDTETFLAVDLASTDPSWQQTGFHLIAGKALAEKSVCMNITFASSETLRLCLEPTSGHQLLENVMNRDYKNTIHDLLQKNMDNFITTEEMLTQWKLTEELTRLLPSTPLRSYAKGTSWEQVLQAKP